MIKCTFPVLHPPSNVSSQQIYIRIYINLFRN
jgi:hypothetical protein